MQDNGEVGTPQLSDKDAFLKSAKEPQGWHHFLNLIRVCPTSSITKLCRNPAHPEAALYQWLCHLPLLSEQLVARAPCNACNTCAALWL